MILAIIRGQELTLVIEPISKGLKTILLTDPVPHQILVIRVGEKGNWSKVVLMAKPED